MFVNAEEGKTAVRAGHVISERSALLSIEILPFTLASTVICTLIRKAFSVTVICPTIEVKYGNSKVPTGEAVISNCDDDVI